MARTGGPARVPKTISPTAVGTPRPAARRASAPANCSVDALFESPASVEAPEQSLRRPEEGRGEPEGLSESPSEEQLDA